MGNYGHGPMLQLALQLVFLWSFGLGVMGYLLGRLLLGSSPHPWHLLAGLSGGILGDFLGWLWRRWRRVAG